MNDIAVAGRGWDVTVHDDRLAVTRDGVTTAYPPLELAALRTRRRWFRWTLQDGGDTVCVLRGARRAQARQLQELIDRLLLDEITAWYDDVQAVVLRATEQQRWVPNETIRRLTERRPTSGTTHGSRRSEPTCDVTERDRVALAFLHTDLDAHFGDLNQQVLQAELCDRRDFFDRVESSPLTEEQARAVVCFDNRVHVLAAAGSGKTSVMVARAAYAIQREFVRPDRILLLAFNKAAAAELQERIDDRLAAAGIDSTGVRAATFHSYGLDVIGRATGSKPRLAPWSDSAQAAHTVLNIVDELRDLSPGFRYRWDLFRLLFGTAPTDAEGGTPDGYDEDSATTGFRTFQGEVVRSAGERIIANWLYLNGVDYEYERPYNVDVSDETHSQYHPDFYYPDVDVWHEHWALDRSGNPPADFDGYADGITWKRQLHQHHGTTLIESTWGDVMFGDGLPRLQEDLEAHGLDFDWNPDRPVSGDGPLKHEDLVRLIRTFMTHVKSNSLDKAQIEERLSDARRHLDGIRTKLFLDIYWPIHDEWNRRLGNDGYVDFEDMLIVAADHLDAGAANMDVDLIMVDEFQDASHARARLVRGLLREPDKFLLAVGDDWQSINRFAGSDISVMTDFTDWFGEGPTLRLSTTFRCPQTLCDVASDFVSKNPRQFNKAVRSVHHAPGPPVQILRTEDAPAAIGQYLERLAEQVANGDVEPSRGARVTVDILGRYQFDRKTMPTTIPANLDVAFRTAHGSKGLEADFVVLPRMESGIYGFPSEIVDDPVLDIVMASPDAFPNAEERRLFYVALTRARQQVTIVTKPGRESAFVVELLQEGKAVVVDEAGVPVQEVETCPACGEGTMVPRSGRYGRFLGCSRFPSCKHTRNLE